MVLLRSVSVLGLTIPLLLVACERDKTEPRPEPATIAPDSRTKPAATAERIAACPSEMVLVDGQYCPNVKQVCTKWMDPDGPFAGIRCAEYKEPSTCDGPREHRRFCIDREEFTKSGDALPTVHASWLKAQETCTSLGKRLCAESEWQFACEGEEMRPYPYGFKRDSTACHIDETNLGKPEEGLNDLRRPANEYPRCVSPFGVHNLTGNVDEWAVREGQPPPYRSALRGGWWLPGRNRCRAATLGHAEYYSGPQVGFRCCKDADASPSPTQVPAADYAGKIGTGD